MRILLSILVLAASLTASAQSLSGEILDETGGSPALFNCCFT